MNPRAAILSLSSGLLRLILQERYQVVPVLVLLETAECHLGAWNVLLWVLEVLKLATVLVCLIEQVIHMLDIDVPRFLPPI